MWVSRVVIEKFRSLQGLDLDLTGPDGLPSPFVAFVGPNGSGKTTILAAIASAIDGALPGVQLRVQLAPTEASDEEKSARANHLWTHSLAVPASGGPDLQFGPMSDDGRHDFRQLEQNTVGLRSRRVLAWWLAQTLRGDGLPGVWDAASAFLGDRRFSGFNDHLDPMFDDPDGRRLTFSQLSAGQQRLVYLFLEIAMVCGRDGILLFDEPEAHLHPAWQLKMRQALMDLLPEGQVIVATHSPFIIDGMPPHQLFVLGDIGATSWSASA